MAKNELVENAKQLELKVGELLERVKQLHTDVGGALQLARRQESKLIEKEREEAKARAEREKAERLKEFLESEEQRGVYSAGSDDEVEAQPAPTAPVSDDRAPINAVAPEEKAPAPVAAVDAKSDNANDVVTKPEKEQPAGSRQDDNRTAKPQQRNEGYSGRRDDNRGRTEARSDNRPQRDNRDNRDNRGSRDNRTGDRPQQRGDKPYGDRPQSGTQQRPRTGGMTPPPAQNNRQHENKGQYVRTFDNDRKQKNKKTLMKESAPSANWNDDEGAFGNRRKAKKQQPQHKPEPVKIEKAILTAELVTVRELSEKIGKPAAEIIKKLFMMGTIATINNEIDFETCELIAADYDIELELQLPKTAEEQLADALNEADSDESLVERPPVVTIMGHVDHGKTSLLDAIRNSSVTAGEAGGITQHIGAYTVTCNGKKITFIDTPGHEAFTAMRARGAQVTDVVILVVAADDGIMPQTVEAINHSKAAGVPIIVAINKMDRPEANPDRVLQQLTEHGLLCEDWGGDTICVPVSAKTHMNLDKLLEMVLLQAEVLELKANPDRKARGTIIEAQLDKGRGAVATVLVQKGTLHVGDPVACGSCHGKVRAMLDDTGARVKSAGPSVPVEILGLSEVPNAGEVLMSFDTEKEAHAFADTFVAEHKNKLVEQTKSKMSLDALFSEIESGNLKELDIIVKADVQGSVEAVKQSLEKLSNEEVVVKTIHGGVGTINESDVVLASASNAIIIGFNVRIDPQAKATADREGVDLRLYKVIYDAINDVESAMKGMLDPIYEEKVIGHAEVRQIFKASGVGNIAGSYVTDGYFQRDCMVRVTREGELIHEGKLGSLKRFKDDVKEVKSNFECGLVIEDFNDVQEMDIIEAYIMVEVPR